MKSTDLQIGDMLRVTNQYPLLAIFYFCLSDKSADWPTTPNMATSKFAAINPIGIKPAKYSYFPVLTWYCILSTCAASWTEKSADVTVDVKIDRGVNR